MVVLLVCCIDDSGIIILQKEQIIHLNKDIIEAIRTNNQYIPIKIKKVVTSSDKLL